MTAAPAATSTGSLPAATGTGREALLELKDVHTYYGRIHALQGIDLVVGRDEIVTLLGSNGAGKTTTLKTASGLLHPRQGKVIFDGKDITTHAGP